MERAVQRAVMGALHIITAFQNLACCKGKVAVKEGMSHPTTLLPLSISMRSRRTVNSPL